MIPARRSPGALRFFDRYVTRYLRRRFHRLHLWDPAAAHAIPRDVPLLVVMNHSAWWDVLVGYYLAREVLTVESYGPMDEAQLRRYPVLARLGLYSIDRHSVAGMRQFLRYTRGLVGPGRALWLTPQGELASAWRRPLAFQPGVGHLIRAIPGVAVVPVALAYEFLDEPRPEILVKIGPAWRPGRVRDAEGAARTAEARLERELDALQDAILGRDLGPFTPTLQGGTSMSLVYDAVRAFRRRWRGVTDPPRHGDVVSDPRRLARP